MNEEQNKMDEGKRQKVIKGLEDQITGLQVFLKELVLFEHVLFEAGLSDKDVSPEDYKIHSSGNDLGMTYENIFLQEGEENAPDMKLDWNTMDELFASLEEQEKQSQDKSYKERFLPLRPETLNRIKLPLDYARYRFLCNVGYSRYRASHFLPEPMRSQYMEIDDAYLRQFGLTEWD